MFSACCMTAVQSLELFTLCSHGKTSCSPVGYHLQCWHVMRAMTKVNHTVVITFQWGSCLATAFAAKCHVPEVPSNCVSDQYVQQHKSQSWQMPQEGRGEQACPVKVCTDTGQRRRTWRSEAHSKP